jgi:hypothetical protein
MTEGKAMESPESMSEAEVRRRLLISAAEDYEPLFHALWEFGIPADPVPGAPSASEVKATLWRLIEEGLVTLYHGQAADGDFVSVPRADLRTVFFDPRAWEVREDPADDYRYSTTPSGDAEVRTSS